MRFIFLLVVSLVLPAAFASDKQSTLLLSWEQFAALKPEQRLDYISELRAIVVKMEEMQNKHEMASYSSISEMKEFVASIELINSLIPQAQAEEKQVWDCPADTRFDPETKTCIELRYWHGKGLPDFPSPENCPKDSVGVPAGGVYAGKFKCIPSTIWSGFDQERQKALKAGKDLEISQIANQKDGAVPPVNSGKSDLCAPPEYNCKQLDQKQKQKLIKEFRADPTTNVCIYGGSFSYYRSNNKKPGNCFPPSTFGSGRSLKGDCKGKVMCNPVLFCGGAQYKDGIKPAKICVDTGANATKACDASYAKRTSAQSKKGWKPCDPTTVIPPAKEAWEKTRKDLDENYTKLCLGNEGFKALFCEECNVISKKLQALNIKYNSKDCLGNTSKNVEEPAAAKPKDAVQ